MQDFKLYEEIHNFWRSQIFDKFEAALQRVSHINFQEILASSNDEKWQNMLTTTREIKNYFMFPPKAKLNWFHKLSTKSEPEYLYDVERFIDNLHLLRINREIIKDLQYDFLTYMRIIYPGYYQHQIMKFGDINVDKDEIRPISCYYPYSIKRFIQYCEHVNQGEN